MIISGIIVDLFSDGKVLPQLEEVCSTAQILIGMPHALVVALFLQCMFIYLFIKLCS